MKSITIDKLTFKYSDAILALDDVSFSVENGESVGIIGANGAGKSTLINHLNGYYLPQHGTVQVNEIVLTRKTQEQIRKIVGVVFQTADDQLFMSRLYDDIAFGLQNLGVNQYEVDREVEIVLKELALWELRERPPSQLSAGQKRFAALATILVMHPQIIVMDEPTSDLDPKHRRYLINLVKKLSATRIIVSHDLDFVWDTCERIIIMAEGRIVADGQKSTILTSQALLEKYNLELPIRFQNVT